jgi:hypothetical protein
MDAQHFREKAEVFLRLADGLSLNDLGRLKLMELAEDLRKRARELEAQAALQPQQSESYDAEYQGGEAKWASLTRNVPLVFRLHPDRGSFLIMDWS